MVQDVIAVPHRVAAMKKARYATRFPCSLCEAAFPSKKKLLAHLDKDHSTALIGICNSKGPPHPI